MINPLSARAARSSRRDRASLPDPSALAEGEFKRSRATRLKILDAGLRLLAEDGFERLSTIAVAERAGITRTALLYHFGSRGELIEALIQHITRRRIEMYREAMADIPHDSKFTARAVRTAWEQLHTPEFAAFIELSLASRTDPELGAVFRAAMESFDHARRDSARDLFPEQFVTAPEFDLRRDLSRFLLEGIVQQQGIVYDATKRRENLLRLVIELGTSEDGIALLRRVARGAGSQGDIG